MPKISIDTLFPLILIVICFFAGYQVSNWVHESNELDKEKQDRQIELERNRAADEVAQRVLDGLSEWKKNTETVVKEMHFETTKPVFYNVCATDDYVRMFNSVQQQSRDALTNKSKSAVSN